ncbi:MAG TPA: glycosyltransferase family 1 protein [Caulobacteraceae bacterium]|nr:glycosyltransferase family 1 protein [Caulobacteraceae bacterium]
MRKICIDGFNLALPKGSGIATYGRNLNAAHRGLGYETQIIYGPNGAVGRNSLLNEVALNDAPEAARTPNVLRRYRSTLTSSTGRTARRVPTSGLVMPSPASQRVQCDVVWAARDLFHTANRCYATYKRFTPLRLLDRKAHPQIVHWTAPLPLVVPGLPNIYTMHDLVPLRLPFTTLDNKRRFYFLCKKLCRTADHIVTVSESARRDLIEMFGVDERRVTNTYQSVSLPPALLAKSDEDVASEVEAGFNLTWRRYFLYFGAVEPKKNLGRIIEAYLGSGATDPLVIVGADGWLTELETKMLYDDLVVVQSVRDNAIRRADRIRRYDYLPLASLVSLIRGAKATIFPSLYEGFGLPVLESMLLGTPVLTSTAGSLPEVAGDAAVTVDPFDGIAIKRGIQALDADEDLRQELARRGRAQAEKFNLPAYQDRLEAVYAAIA